MTSFYLVHKLCLNRLSCPAIKQYQTAPKYNQVTVDQALNDIQQVTKFTQLIHGHGHKHSPIIQIVTYAHICSD